MDRSWHGHHDGHREHGDHGEGGHRDYVEGGHHGDLEPVTVRRASLMSCSRRESGMGPFQSNIILINLRDSQRIKLISQSED